jgi:hypothetical protein
MIFDDYFTILERSLKFFIISTLRKLNKNFIIITFKE